MKKKIIPGVFLGLLVISAIIILCCYQTKKGIPPESEVCLSDSELSASIRYGREYQKSLLVDFQKPWAVVRGYSENGGRAIIYPPFHCLALITRNAGSEILGVDTETLRKLTAKEVCLLRFEVTLYGNELGFDRNYTGVVVKGEQQFASLKTVSRGYDQAREYTIAGRRDYYFTPEILKGKGKITLRILRPQKESIEFTFNLTDMP
ncbi:MAG: hypothetical protein V2A65_02860 [Candidatus Omnitrophota bacterium]